MCVSVHLWIRMQYLQMPVEGVRSPGAGVMSHLLSLLDLNSCLLKEWHMLLTIEPPPHPHILII